MKFIARTGMVVVETSGDYVNCGTVVAIAPDIVSVAIGDLIGFWCMAATTIWRDNGMSYVGMREDNVVAVIEAEEIRRNHA